MRAFYCAMELVADVVADLLLVALQGLQNNSGSRSDVSNVAAFRAVVEESSTLLSDARLQSVDVIESNLLGLLKLRRGTWHDIVLGRRDEKRGGAPRRGVLGRRRGRR